MIAKEKLLVRSPNIVYLNQGGKEYLVTFWDQGVQVSFRNYDRAIEYSLMVAGYYQTYVIALGKYQYFPNYEEDYD